MGSYTYDDTQKNAVTSVSNSWGIIPLTDQDITYTGFNKASEIIEDPYELDITYGIDNQRIKSVLRNDGNIVKTKYYSAGYEKEITAGGTRELHYVNCPYGLVALLVKQGGITTTYFTETDHLGSILGLLNPNGTYAERYSYDAWGRRRNPVNWTYSGVSQPVLIERGYTGHEHLDSFGLIDMNGRMYDPVIGRFLGVDPIIQELDNSQSINGYSYCLNNPLIFIDPSGYLKIPGWLKYLIDLFTPDCNNPDNRQNNNQRFGTFLHNLFGGDSGDSPAPLSVYRPSPLYFIGSEMNTGLNRSSIQIPTASGGTYTMEMNRIAESPNATLSKFTANGPIPLNPVSGYILEPSGPSTIARWQDRRVLEGIYNVTPYSSINHPNVYRISNAQVPLDRYILFHIGNYHSNTSACLLPGSSYTMVSGNYAVWNSTATLNKLRSLWGSNNSTLIIRDIYLFNFICD